MDKIIIDNQIELTPKSSDLPNQLIIIENNNAQEIRYNYDLRSISLNILKRYESKPISSKRYEYVKRLYREIENRWLNNQDDVDLFSEELRAFGGQLFDQIFPEELQKTLWENRNAISSIMVISTEPFIPWELLHLKPPGQKQLPEETIFLGQMGLVRWLYDAGWPSDIIKIRAKQAYSIIPKYPLTQHQLPQTEDERNFLAERFQAISVEPQLKAVLNLIKSGRFDLLHFAGHGIHDLDSMMTGNIMLEGQLSHTYRKQFLSSTLVEQFFDVTEKSENRPLIVLNACQVGQSSYALTGMSGFAQAFLKGGAGAFIGPLWSVGDTPARIFTESLYEELLKGKNISEAAKLARSKAKESGDATWLAYSVYGHPHLKLQYQSSTKLSKKHKREQPLLDKTNQN